VAGAPPASVDSYTNVSASLGWQFNENFSLSLDGMNLLNEKYYQFDRESNRAWNDYSTGRRYLASVHFKF
jgi:outer membrane receptor protein involved in Fe transport